MTTPRLPSPYELSPYEPVIITKGTVTLNDIVDIFNHQPRSVVIFRHPAYTKPIKIGPNELPAGTFYIDKHSQIFPIKMTMEELSKFTKSPSSWTYQPCIVC